MYAYSYSAINTSDRPIEISINLIDKSKNMMFVPKAGKVIKVIQPGAMEFLMHSISDPTCESFGKKCSVQARFV